ncbi:MAG: sel1 repeat family protein [Alphaproteobacteria bacterium]|nr:sel1 repeat family protein [Alphaproteobacteria bacterium]
MTLITPIHADTQAEPAINVSIYRNKATLKDKVVIRDYGTITSIPLSLLTPSNKTLFSRFVIIYCPPSQVSALPQEFKKQGWDIFLKAQGYLISKGQINTSITSREEYDQHTRNVSEFYESLTTLLSNYPNSPLIPIVNYQLGIYNQYFLKKLSIAEMMSRALTSYIKAADQNYAPAQYKLGKALSKGTLCRADPKKGIDYLERASQQDNPQAQYLLGTFYEEAKRYCDAMMYYQKAADQDNAKALFKVGFFCEHTIGTKIDVSRAFKAYEKAARLGHAEACYRAGFCCDQGIGTMVDKKRALTYFTIASSYKIAEAICKLGEYAECGIAGPADLPKAIEHYGEAAGLNNSLALYKLGVVHQLGINKNEINLKLALIYYQRAAKNGYGPAEYNLGEFAEFGYVGAVDIIKAICHYQIAASKKHAQAYYKLGILHEVGTLPSSPHENAFLNFIKASEQNHAAADYKLYTYYLEGIGGPQKDTSKAFTHLTRAAEASYAPALYKMGEFHEQTDQTLSISYYQKAAEKEYPPALYKMGELEDKGLIERVNPDQISTYYLKAADRNHPDALFQIGLCHEKGTRTPIDISKAIEFYQKASQQKHSAALIKLETLDPSSFLNRTQRIIDAQLKVTTLPPVKVTTLPPAQAIRAPFSGWPEFKVTYTTPRPTCVIPSDIMADDHLFLPLGTYPRPEECSQTLLDQLHTEEHRAIVTQSGKRQKIQTFLV